MRVWEGRGRGSSVHVYRTCRRISRYGFCLSGGGVGLESRMTSCYLIKLTGCSSDVFENTSKRKKKFHFIGVAYRSTHLRPKKPRFCAETLYTVFPRVKLYLRDDRSLLVSQKPLLDIYCFFLWVSFKVFLIFCVTSFDDRTQPQHKETTMMMSIFSFMLCFSN